MTSNEAMVSGQGVAQEENPYKITKKDLIRSSLNVGALGMEFSWTYYKQMNLAFCLMVAGMLKKIYHGRPDDYAAALHRHAAFFNITVQFAPFVGGIAMAMEERVARGEIEPESVNDVKAALMGPSPASATQSSSPRFALSPLLSVSRSARRAMPPALSSSCSSTTSLPSGFAFGVFRRAIRWV